MNRTPLVGHTHNRRPIGSRLVRCSWWTQRCDRSDIGWGSAVRIMTVRMLLTLDLPYNTRIFWPFTGDQPLNAIHYTDNLQIGYELLEVRSGHGLKPIYRTGYTPKGTIEAVKAEAREVLAKAFGEDGAQKRARLQELRKKVTSEWEDGGSSKRDVCTFLDSL